MSDIATPKRTQAILKKFDLNAKKSLGQNFIIDRNILMNMIAAGGVDSQKTVIEIGPGIGALTEQIAKVAKQVYAFEIDERMLKVLAETLKPYDNVTVFHQDVLAVDWASFQKEYLAPDEQVIVLANLPYYITTPILMDLFESELPFSKIVVMMQKEVAARLQAEPGTKAYGSLSIAVQRQMSVEVLFEVSPNVFNPRPNVTSAVIAFTPLKKPLITKDEAFTTRLVRASFAQRRKTLWNNLRIFYKKDQEKLRQVKYVLKMLHIDPSRRAETLSVHEFVELSNALIQNNSKK